MSKKIRVDFSEKEDIVISPDNNRIKHDVTAVVSIQNPATQSRVWAMELSVSQSENTERLQPGSYDVGVINPESTWTREYSVRSPIPVLTLTEDIDTDFKPNEENPERHTLLFNKEAKVLFQITIKNTFGKKKIDNIKVIKHLPSIAGEAMFLGEVKGQAVQVDNTIKWNVPELFINEEAVLRVYVPCTPTNGDAVGAGEIDVTYEVENHNIVESEPYLTSQVMVKPQVKPIEVAPDEWQVDLKFTGNEELDVQLEEFEVSQAGESLYKKPEGHNEIIADRVWEDSFNMTFSEYPNLEKVVKYRPLWYITRSIHSKIKKLEWILPVLKINVTKTLDPPECLSYARTDIQVSSVIENTGTGVIIEGIFSEIIPPYLYLKPETVEVAVNGRVIDKDRYTVETQTLEEGEDDSNLKVARPLTTKVNLDTETGIISGEKLQLTYIIHA
ncbi:MAG: hypothetical protein ACFFBD_16480, partial [Candidatus Hodarchaeota archaeon]